MDGFTAPEVSMASIETPSAPSEAAPSASAVPEAPSAAMPATSDAPVAETSAESVPAAPTELPDEQAFERLTGPERGNNWKQARARIAELNSQVERFTPYQQAIEQMEQAGGWEQLQQSAELGSLLFSPVQDPQTGQTYFTAEPLIERLAQESPGTLGELVWKGLSQPSPWYSGETILDSIIQDHLKLNPALLDTYRQIQSPQDAQKFIAPGQITPEELAGIPAEFHDAYKSLSPKQREELALTSDEEVRREFLQDKADALQTRQFIAQQKQQEEQRRQQQAQEFQSRVEQRGDELGALVRDAAIASVREKLNTEALFHADKEINSALHDDVIQWSAQQLLSDPTSLQDNNRCDQLYRLSANAELRGDVIQARQYKVQADQLAKALEGRFRNLATKRVAFWSSAFGSARQAQQQQVQQARPRAEIAASNQASRQNTPTQTVGKQNSFGFSPAQIEQYEQMIRARQMAQ